MANNLFSITRDRQVLEAGGFWCEACIIAKPLDDQSPDPRYCLGCYDSLVEQASRVNPNAGRPRWVPEGAKLMELEKGECWSKDNSVFIHHGEKFGIIPGGETVSGGFVSVAILVPQDNVEPVTKIPILPPPTTAVPRGIMLQEKRGRGRPPKTEGEPVSRMTEWRREKETQGALL